MYQDTYGSSVSEDLFKKHFKYYKSNKPKPSLCQVITADKNCLDKVTAITSKIKEYTRTGLLGLRKQPEWNTYIFKQHPGLILIRNPFTASGQRYWIRQCLEVYPRKPNKINIDIETHTDDWWKECYKSGECNTPLQKKLRWTTLGYHHNWDTKVYSEQSRSSFPEDLAELSDVLASYFGYKNYKAQAAIVNYYHMDSTLSAHTDHSEINLEAPLFSISFGQSAIFLIGGKDKSIEPSAILLQSGDIIVMSKEARLCYHAVPKILPTKDTPWNSQELSSNINDFKNVRYLSDPKAIVDKMNRNLNDLEWSNYNSYITESRININVRQVLNEKENSLLL